MPNFKVNVLTAAVAAIAAGTAVAPAWAVDGQGVLVLDQVSVTATGHETATLETPHAVTVMEREAIAETPADNVGDLLRGEPGMAVAADGAWGMNPVLRGLKKEHVVIMVDGMRLNSAQPAGAIASFVNLDQVERVEVVKGPVSVLYGSGAMGGVVNLITRKTEFSAEPRMEGEVSLGASSADDGRRGSAVLGLANQRHALDLSVSAIDVGDYESPEGTVEHTGYEQQAVSARYRARVGEDSELSLNLQRQRDEDVWYPGSAKPHPFHGTQTIRSPEQERSLYELAYAADLAGAAEPHLRVNVYRQEVERQIRAFSERLQRDVVRTDVTFSTVGAGARVELAPAERHLVTVGVDAWEMQGDPARYRDTNPPAFDNNLRIDPFSDGRIRSAGVYVQDEVLLERWSLKGGARFDHITGDAAMAAGLPPGSDLEHTDETLSWSLGGVYHHSRAVNPYVNLGRAHRAADMRERFESAPRGDGYFHQGNPQLDPEVSTTLELGVKGIAGANRYALAAYRSQIEDYIIGRITGQTHPVTGLPMKRTENLAEVTLTGIEGEVERDLGNDYAAFGSFTWLRGENRHDDEPLSEVPPPEFTLGLRHAPELHWNWEAAVRHVTEQDRVGTRLTNGTEDTTPAFTTVDVGVGYRFGAGDYLSGHSLRLAVSNLLDESYHEHLTDGVSGLEPPAPGRNVYLTWRATF